MLYLHHDHLILPHCCHVARVRCYACLFPFRCSSKLCGVSTFPFLFCYCLLSFPLLLLFPFPVRCVFFPSLFDFPLHVRCYCLVSASCSLCLAFFYICVSQSLAAQLAVLVRLFRLANRGLFFSGEHWTPWNLKYVALLWLLLLTARWVPKCCSAP